MKSQIKQILLSIPKNSRRKYLTNEMISWLDQTFPGHKFSYQCELVLQDIYPNCPVCGGIPSRGKITCSATCREKYKEINGSNSFEKSKATMMKRYGVDNPALIPKSQTKRINTIIEKYGSKVSETTRESARERAHKLNAKAKITIKNKYGIDNVSQLPDHSDKVKASLLNKHGVNNYFHSQEWKEIQKTNQISRIDDLLGNNIELLNVVQPNLELKNAYINPNSRVSFKCHDCGNSEMLPTETLKFRLKNFFTPCGKCSNVNNSHGSAAEKNIAEWLKTIYPGEVIENNRTIIAPYELDIVLPEKQIAIEYCGLYWHNDQRIDKNYHLEKMKRCNAAGYQLITIFEDEWMHKPDIVRSRLRSKLGLIKKSIGARQCKIMRIESSTARSFLELYHIQGYQPASKRYGLTFMGDLVAVMTFTKGNLAKRQTDWELSRFCVKDDLNINGAAGRLFNYFVKTENPDQVVTFSDLRWNTGHVYTQIGFDFCYNSRINYWYIDGNKRINRFKLRKQLNEPQDISENLLRKSQGWNRIWDCGNAKYVWTKV